MKVIHRNKQGNPGTENIRRYVVPETGDEAQRFLLSAGILVGKGLNKGKYVFGVPVPTEELDCTLVSGKISDRVKVYAFRFLPAVEGSISDSALVKYVNDETNRIIV